MSKEKILTISVAAYNVEKYLKNTLDSLIVPEVIDDIEVLVVDDGGIDNSLIISKEYAAKYPNTFKAIHKENGGYGSTVNYSIEHATGKYFKLLDGDDWFDKEGLIKLVNLLKEIDVDAVFTQFIKNYNNSTVLAICYDETNENKIISIDDFNFNAGVPMHALTMKTQILKESGMKLPEHTLYTDNIYAAESFINVKQIYCCNFPVYEYRLDVEGQSVSKEGLIKHTDESKNISLKLVNFYVRNVNNDIKSKKYIKMNVSSTCINYVVGILNMKPSRKALEMLKSFDNEVKILSTEIYEDMPRLDRKASFALKLIRATNYLLYWLFALIEY